MSVPSITLSGGAVLGSRPTVHGLMDRLPQTVKLGRIRPKAVPQALRLGLYLWKDSVPTPPDTLDYYTKAAAAIAHMYLNDTYGDCVIAGKYHAVGIWTANESGTAVVGTDQEVYKSYQGICGPGDNGCVITDVLDYMKAKGLPFNGQAHGIAGYVSIDWTNKLEVQVALLLFGALTIGINLPAAWESNSIWDVTNTQIVGGHDVTVVGWDSIGFQISSWGRIYTITFAAFQSKKWLEETYALLAPDWYEKAGTAPNGLDANTLAADLQKLGGGEIPDITPPGPPVVPPVVPPVGPPPPPPPAPIVLTGTGKTMDYTTKAIQVRLPRAMGTITIPSQMIPGQSFQVQVPLPSLETQDSMRERYGLTPQQWAQLIAEISAIIAQFLGGGGTSRGLSEQTDVRAKYGLSPGQWAQLVAEIQALISHLFGGG